MKTNRIFPCDGVRMFPVMFWIQPSVPSSTAPTGAWVPNSRNRRNGLTAEAAQAAEDRRPDQGYRPPPENIGPVGRR